MYAGGPHSTRAPPKGITVDQSANPSGATDPADLGPDPAPLDPAVEDEVRTRLRTLRDAGPMPRAVSERIAGVLADEARLRVTRGPLAGQDPDADVLAPLIRSRQRPRPWLAIAAVAAAAVVVAVGGSALHFQRAIHPTAAVSAGTTSPSPTSPVTVMHIQVSDTDYEPATFAAQVRSTTNRPQPPLPSLDAEAPGIGPVATPIALESCLEALGEFPPYTVLADLATYDGRPAAIIAVTRPSGTTAYAVLRSCRPGNAQILRDATPVP